MPFEPVVTTHVVPEHGDAKLPEAPEAGAWNVTATPGTGPFESVTAAASGEEKVVVIPVYWFEPEWVAIAPPLPMTAQQYVVEGPALFAASVANTVKQCPP